MGWTLTYAAGISDDGLTMVGLGVHNGETESWNATIPGPGAAGLLCPLALAMVRRRIRK